MNRVAVIVLAIVWSAASLRAEPQPPRTTQSKKAATEWWKARPGESPRQRMQRIERTRRRMAAPLVRYAEPKFRELVATMCRCKTSACAARTHGLYTPMNIAVNKHGKWQMGRLGVVWDHWRQRYQSRFLRCYNRLAPAAKRVVPRRPVDVSVAINAAERYAVAMCKCRKNVDGTSSAAPCARRVQRDFDRWADKQPHRTLKAADNNARFRRVAKRFWSCYRAAVPRGSAGGALGTAGNGLAPPPPPRRRSKTP